MRNKKQIADLEWCAPQVNFPKYNTAFQKFGASLGEAVQDNFGYSIAKTLIYDEDTQGFWMTVDKSGPMARTEGTPLVLCIQRHVAINPKLPLLPQFEAVQAVIDEVDSTYNTLYAYHMSKNDRTQSN